MKRERITKANLLVMLFDDNTSSSYLSIDASLVVVTTPSRLWMNGGKVVGGVELIQVLRVCKPAVNVVPECFLIPYHIFSQTFFVPYVQIHPLVSLPPPLSLQNR